MTITELEELQRHVQQAQRTEHDEHCNVTYTLRFPMRHGGGVCNCRIAESWKWLFDHQLEIAAELIDTKRKMQELVEATETFFAHEGGLGWLDAGERCERALKACKEMK